MCPTSDVTIPYEIIIHIMSYLKYSELPKLENGRHIFYKLTSRIYTPLSYKKGAYNNICDMCFYCGNSVTYEYNINLCKCSEVMKDLGLDFTYPSICFGCTQKVSRGEQIRFRCKLCGETSTHLGISFCS